VALENLTWDPRHFKKNKEIAPRKKAKIKKTSPHMYHSGGKDGHVSSGVKKSGVNNHEGGKRGNITCLWRKTWGAPIRRKGKVVKTKISSAGRGKVTKKKVMKIKRETRA